VLTNTKNILRPYYFCTTMIGMLCQIEWIEERALACSEIIRIFLVKTTAKQMLESVKIRCQIVSQNVSCY